MIKRVLDTKTFTTEGCTYNPNSKGSRTLWVIIRPVSYVNYTLKKTLFACYYLKDYVNNKQLKNFKKYMISKEVTENPR